MVGAKQITLSIVLLLAVSSNLQAQSHIPWVTSWQEASVLADRYQRMVLIHFWSNNCPPCVRLERSVFNRPEVIRAVVGNYVPLKVNVDQNAELTRYFQVEQWPTDIIVDAKGAVLYRGTSPQDPNRYIATLGQVAAHARVRMPFSGSPSTEIAAARRDSGSAPRASAFPVGAAAGAASSVPTPPTTRYRGFAPADGRNTMPASEPMPTMHMPAAGATPTGRTAPGGSMIMNPRIRGMSIPTSPQASQPRAPEQQVAFTPPNTGPSFGATSIPPYGANPSSRPTQNQFVATGGQAAAGTSSESTPPSGGRAEATVESAAAPNTQSGTPLAMEGYCCVTLVEQEKWVKGDPKWGAVHRGRTYLFTSAQQQQRFLADYDRYAPALSGFDCVKYAEQRTLVDGKRAHGIFYRGQVFLFADEAALQKFWGEPQRYAGLVRAEQDRQAARR